MWKSPLLRFPSVRGNGGKPAVGFPPFPQRVISTDSRWNLFTHRLCYRTRKIDHLAGLEVDTHDRRKALGLVACERHLAVVVVKVLSFDDAVAVLALVHRFLVDELR